MRRFYLETSSITNNTAVLEGSEAHHIVQVLRLGKKDKVLLFDENGQEYEGTITSAHKRRVEVVLTKRSTTVRSDSVPAITIAQALLKADKMDFVVQKCTELGAKRLVPFWSQRTVVRGSPETLQHKWIHWCNIAIAAVKQSGIRGLPCVEQPIKFQDMLQRVPGENLLKLILWEQEHTVTLKQVVQREQKVQHQIVVVIGPEGGFADDEIECARAHGFIPTGIGTQTLRAETAAIAVMAMLCYEYML